MFVTFEGPDGSGKTTVLELLTTYLKKRQVDFILTREPGSEVSNVNRRIRAIIVDNNSDITPMAEAILFSADRRLHLEKVVWPALAAGKIVLCDRYIDSTFAYQGSGRELGIDKMIELQENITDKTYPNFTFYFDLPVEESIKRINKRGDLNRIDQEGVTFFKRVYDGYQDMIARDPQRFVVIDASQSVQVVYQEVLQKFMDLVLKTKI